MEIYMNIDMYDNICKELNSNWCFLKFNFFVKNSHIEFSDYKKFLSNKVNKS